MQSTPLQQEKKTKEGASPKAHLLTNRRHVLLFRHNALQDPLLHCLSDVLSCPAFHLILGLFQEEKELTNISLRIPTPHSQTLGGAHYLPHT